MNEGMKMHSRCSSGRPPHTVMHSNAETIVEGRCSSIGAVGGFRVAGLVAVTARQWRELTVLRYGGCRVSPSNLLADLDQVVSVLSRPGAGFPPLLRTRQRSRKVYWNQHLSSVALVCIAPVGPRARASWVHNSARQFHGGDDRSTAYTARLTSRW